MKKPLISEIMCLNKYALLYGERYYITRDVPTVSCLSVQSPIGNQIRTFVGTRVHHDNTIEKSQGIESLNTKYTVVETAKPHRVFAY